MVSFVTQVCFRVLVLLFLNITLGILTYACEDESLKLSNVYSGGLMSM